MVDTKKVLLLIGSPKTKGSTSASLGNYLLKKLAKKNFECQQLRILTGKNDNMEEIIDKVRESDILIITAPLYIDSFPAPLIRAFEKISNDIKEKSTKKKQSLVAIVNSGFPEAYQNNTAIKICKNFGDKNNFKWLGSLTMGCGPIIRGKPIDKLGVMTRNIVKAINIAADAIAEDQAIPAESMKSMAKTLLPIWLYMELGNYSWKSSAKKFKAEKQLYARPYQFS